MVPSQSEWEQRTSYLANAFVDLVKRYVKVNTGRGLDVGCAEGVVADVLKTKTGLEMFGVDPRVGGEICNLSPGGSKLYQGRAHQLPFPDAHFDCIILANVYEHIPPNLRSASLQEIRRVLVTGGMLIGQIPNPLFPIEQHSRLPLMGFMPKAVQLRYWQLAPVSKAHYRSFPRDWFPVTINELKSRGRESGFEVTLIRKFGYPADAFPISFRRIAHLLEHVFRSYPFAWQFAFRAR
jgi:SAM-dependent methyltransferase